MAEFGKPTAVEKSPKSITELSKELYAALDEVQAKRNKLEELTDAAAKAGQDYQVSVSKATTLRDELDAEMNKILPSSMPSRVRVSG